MATNRLRIGVSALRTDNFANYLRALEGSGADWEIGAEISADRCDGLLLPGGVDVEPWRYGQEADPRTECEPELDRVQLETLRRFLEKGKPVFGICRGHQVINVALGGTLIQHLPTADRHMRVVPDEDQVHECTAEPDSFVAALYGPRFAVNSSHHQGVDVPGDGLRVVLRSADGVAEALQHDTLPIWSVQFHPERMGFAHRREDTVDGEALFRFFLERCAERKG